MGTVGENRGGRGRHVNKHRIACDADALTLTALKTVLRCSECAASEGADPVPVNMVASPTLRHFINNLLGCLPGSLQHFPEVMYNT